MDNQMNKSINDVVKFKIILCEKKAIRSVAQFFLFLSSLIYYRRIYIYRRIKIRQYRTAHCIIGIPRTLYKDEIYVVYRRPSR